MSDLLENQVTQGDTGSHPSSPKYNREENSHIGEPVHLDFEDWERIYKPRINHLAEDAPYNGFMYETYGEEVEYVQKQDSNNVWTVLNDDNGDLVIVSGVHFINRMGYIITEEPHNFKDITVEDD